MFFLLPLIYFLIDNCRSSLNAKLKSKSIIYYIFITIYCHSDAYNYRVSYKVLSISTDFKLCLSIDVYKNDRL